MNRRNNPRGAQNRNSQVQTPLDQSFNASNGSATANQQQEPPKVEPKVEEPVQNNNDTMPVDDDAGEDSEGGIGAKMRKIFANRKNLSAADRKRLEKERKARQLRRLRKLLTPKNAVVALHELQGPGMSEFTINTNGQETTAEIVVNNVRYEATAPNKHLAKARASEKALRDLVIAQMAKARQASENKDPAAANNGNNGNTSSTEDVEMAEVSESDDVPMLHLASYALYKLFNEWQNEGFEIPAIKPAKAPVKLTETGVHPLAPKVTKTKADVPSDAPTRHPTALLAFMRPQIPYEDLGSNNNNDPAKREFSVGVTVDGQRYIDDDNEVDELDIPDPHIQKEIRSMLCPRTAMTVLHTIHNGLPLGQIIFDPNSPIHEQSGILKFNNIRYYALAQNRRLVKTRLSEQIFRDLVLGEMRKIVTEVFPNVDNPMKMEVDAEVIFAQDDFPLNHVVSYALHKLEELWAIDGYSLPDFRPKARKLKRADDSVSKPPCVPKRKRGVEDLPSVAPEMNPTCLLAYMRPLAKYEEQPVAQDAAVPWFKYILTVDDVEFEGEAPSKKQARRNAAAQACNSLFSVEFAEPDY